jgi:hypothetical protein
MSGKRKPEDQGGQPAKRTELDAKPPAKRAELDVQLDASQLGVLTKLFKGQQSEYSLVFSSTGLTIQFLTADHTGIMRAWFDADLAPRYHCTREVVVGVSAEAMLQAFKFASPGGLVQFTTDFDRVTPMLTLCFEQRAEAANKKPGKERASQKVKLGIPKLTLDGDGEELTVDEVPEKHCTAILPAFEFYRNLKVMATMGIDEVKLTIGGPELRMTVPHRDVNTEIDIQIDLTDPATGMYECTAPKPLTLAFAIRLLNYANVSQHTKFMEFTVAENYPGLLRYKMDWGEFAYWLSPKIDDED